MSFWRRQSALWEGDMAGDTEGAQISETPAERFERIVKQVVNRNSGTRAGLRSGVKVGGGESDQQDGR